MAQRIRRFGIGQTAKVVGVLYVIMGLLFLPFLLVAAAFAPRETGFGTGLALGLPIIYGVAGFIFTAVACAIYNFVAGFVGGIEVELESERATT